MGIAFRRARPGDAPGLTGLVEELGYPSTARALGLRLERLLGEPDQAVFVAERVPDGPGAAGETPGAAPGELLGWVHVQEFLSLASDPSGLVTGLVVTGEQRGRGLGRGLMAAAEAWARARGLASMRLRARVARGEAHAFYRHLGYTLAKKQLQFRKALDG